MEGERKPASREAALPMARGPCRLNQQMVTTHRILLSKVALERKADSSYALPQVNAGRDKHLSSLHADDEGELV
jgi:hypothetical protein